VPRNGRDLIASKSVLPMAVRRTSIDSAVTWLISMASGSVWWTRPSASIATTLRQVPVGHMPPIASTVTSGPSEDGGGTSAQPATTRAKSAARITRCIVRDDGRDRQQVTNFEHRSRPYPS
jgi:hypothetical protein